MKTVEIHITEGKNTEKISVLFPEKWEELTTAQLFDVAPTLFDNEMPSDERFMKVLRCLMNVDDATFTKMADLLIDKDRELDQKLMRSKNPEEMKALLDQYNPECSILDLWPLVEWIFKTNAIESSQSLVPEHDGFTGPKAELYQFSFIRWATADPIFMLYLEERSEATLDQLIAVLYIPEAETFNGDSTPWLKTVKNWPLATKQGMLLNFIALRRWLINVYDILFSQPEEGEETTYDSDWGRSLIYELPNDKFGDIDQVKQTSVIQIFDFLEYEKTRPKNDQQPPIQ